MYALEVRVFDTDAASYYGRHPNKYCLIMSVAKSANILMLAFSDNATSQHLCSQWMG